MERENILYPMMRPQSLRESVPLGCELHRYFSVLLPTLGEAGWHEEARMTGVGSFHSPKYLGSEKISIGFGNRL